MKNRLAYFLTALMALPIMGQAATISGEVDGGLAGTVINNFVPGATVTLISGTGSQAVVLSSTTTTDNGQYVFTNVPVGFMQVNVTADGYVNNSASTSVLSVNSDTASVAANFVLLKAGSQVISGTSSIGGQVVASSELKSGIQVNLRRRATNASAYVVVDSTFTDSLGSYLFANIASAGANSDINAYSLTVNAGGYNAFVSAGTITVAENATVISNITLTPTALVPGLSSGSRPIRFSRVGDQLAIELGSSKTARTVEIYALNGNVQRRISVSANTSRVMVSASFAPEKGFLFRIK